MRTLLVCEQASGPANDRHPFPQCSLVIFLTFSGYFVPLKYPTLFYWLVPLLLTSLIAWFAADDPENQQINSALLKFEQSPDDEVALKSIVSTEWVLICATSTAFGEALASSPDERNALQQIVKSTGIFETEVDWRLSIFSRGNQAPVTYRFSRRKLPFTDGPLLKKLKPTADFHGTPVLCTRRGDVVIRKIRVSPLSQPTLTLIEP